MEDKSTYIKSIVHTDGTNPHTNIDFGDSNYCWHLLPCGICRLTNAPCPKYNGQSYPNQPFYPNQPYITWTTRTNDPLPDLNNHSTCEEHKE